MMSPDPVYVVIGHRRSGTSMLMRSLIEGGMTAVYSRRREDGHSTNFRGQRVNPSGLWELQICDRCRPYLDRSVENDVPPSKAVPEIRRCLRLDCQMTFYSQPHRYSGKLVKDWIPGSSWALIEWEGGYQAAMIWREHDESAASWNRVWGAAYGARYASDVKMHRYCFDQTRDTAPCPVTELEFPDVIAHPHRNFQRMSDEGWPIDVAKAATIPDPKFYRNRAA